MIKFVLENFDTIFRNEKSLESLNKIILDLAIKGKLVEQNSEDEPASELLKRIKEEKERLIKEKVIKKEKELPKIEKDEIPFEIPESWEWVRLGEIITLKGGKRVDNGYKLLETPTNHIYIRITDMKDFSVKENDLRYIDDTMYEKIKNYIIKKEDLYITIAGTIGYVGEIPEKFDGMNLTENAGRIILYFMNKRFLRYILNSNFIQEQFQEMVNKMAQPKLALTRIQETLVPIPNLKEQQKIVEKIERLQELIRNLKEVYLANEESRLNLKKSLLAEIEKSNSDKELLKNLELVFSNFDKVIRSKEDIKDIRNLILSLAIKGKLVEQNPEDEPASELLKRIKEEKERLIKEKIIKKEKELSKIEKDEIPFEIPESWEWVRLGEVVDFNVGKTPSRHNELYWENGEYNWVSIADMKNGEVLYSTKEKVSKKASDEIFKNNISEIGDLLMSFKLSIGKLCILGIKAYHNEAIVTLKVRNSILKNYLFKLLNSFDLLSESNKAIKGVTLNSTSLKNVKIAIPPLAEQQRIIERVEKLMSICDMLEEKIVESERVSEKLLESLVKYEVK